MDSSGSCSKASPRRVAGLALAVGLASCSVGVGVGEITGSVSVPQCDLETEAYSLGPTFYTASPFEEQLTIRIQKGGDYPIESDGLSIVVLDATMESGRLGTPIPLTGEEAAPVSMSFYLNDSCPVGRDDLPVFLRAVEGTITFENIYAPEVDGDQRETAGTFENVRFVSSDPDGEAVAILSGDFRFLFERGRPGQPFP